MSSIHVANSLTADGLLTVTNPNNIASGDRFVLILATNPDNVITGAPVNYTVTINGTAVQIRNKYAARVSSDKLEQRRPYRGYYLVPTDGEDPYVVIDTYRGVCESQSSAPAASTVSGG